MYRAFLEVRDRPCDEIARELIHRVREWARGGVLEDDLTVVVLKRHAGPAPVPEDPRRTTGSLAAPKPA